MAIRFNNEIKVGVFALIGIIIFTIFVFSIADVKFFIRTYEVNVVFGFANGVKISSPVRLAGVDVGQVKKITVDFNKKTGKNEVTILSRIKSNAVIPRDSQVWVNTLGLLGEKYIEIIPGVNYADIVRSGDTLVGKDPVAMQEITELGREIVTKLNTSIDGINELLNEENKNKFTKVLENLEEATSSLDEILDKINKGSGTAGKFISDEVIYTDTKEFIEDIKKHPWKLMRKPEE